ncbi:MAG: O-methyltransferase, partial [Planctomycetota bacterium]
HADVARESFARAGVDDRVELIEGPALDSLETLPAKHPAGFDLVFIDADKENYPAYWKWAVRLSHAGTLIIADNVVRDGELINRESDDPRVVAVREYLELVANDPRVTDATLQTVGAKGYDGLSLAVVH